ncbi:Ig-like domain repeat protein [Methanobrevibacter millerae]|uniref:Adhesin-like protein n=1 Tax=Methanobrevibacter millerae TaxID=230361 RepID=A0A0U3EA95_9EURY|nr:Ig-like domain repeat protein [Methanobrevibacter millerae]ALT69888.1 adhesin-like protein [Methanobrevibacter millerae]
MQKKLLFISIMLIVLCSVSAVSASEINGTDDAVGVDSDVSAPCDIVSASEINGTDEVDSGDLLSAPSTSTVTVSTWSNLKSACTNATQYDTIYVSGGITPPSTKGQISINKNVIIEGLSGSYIGGSSSNNVVTVNYIPFSTTTNGLNITFKNLNFQNINLQNPNFFTSGVLMYFAGNGNYACENCNFNNINGTGNKQSIIYLRQGAGDITNCNFTNNVLSFGTITNFYSSSSSTVNNARMSISDCRFTNNYGSYAPGAINNCGYMDIQNSIFENNGADKWAGAVLSFSNATTNIVNSSFKNNVAGWNGGAIYTYSILNVSDSTFEGNNCTTNNGGGAIGALSYGSTYNVTVDNCIFKNNHNLDSAGYGGAISAMDAGYFHLYYSTFINNTATTGKAIAVREGEYIDDNHTWDENVTLGNPVFGIAYNTFVDVEAHSNDVNIAYVSNNASYIAAHNNTFYTPSEYANLGNQQSNIFNNELLGLSVDDVELIGDSQDTPQWSMDGFDSSNSMESPYGGVSNGILSWNKSYADIFSLVIDKDGYLTIGQINRIDFLNNEGTVEKYMLVKQADYPQMENLKLNCYNIAISSENIINVMGYAHTSNMGNNYEAFYILPEDYNSPGEFKVRFESRTYPDLTGTNFHCVYVIENNEINYICISDGYLAFYTYNREFSETDFSYHNSYDYSDQHHFPPLLNVIVANNKAWATSSDSFIIYDVSNNKINSISAPGIVGTPVADSNGNVYFFTSDSISKADSTNGVTKTQAVTGGTGSRMAISTTNKALYSVNSLGTLYKYSLADLTESEVYDIGSTASTIMTDANGIIYVGSDDGKFYAFDDEGNKKWMVDTESNSAVKNCAMDNEGNIYFYTAENKVYAINQKLEDANLTFETNDTFTTLDNITFTANINSTLDGQNITFTVTGKDVNYKNEYNATIADGAASWNIGALGAGNYEVEAKYNSDGTYATSIIAADFEVSKVTPELSVNINNATVFENASITVTSNNCKGNVTVKVGDETYEDVVIGEEFILPLLPAEIYDVTVTYNEDDVYTEAVNDTEKLEISKVTPELSVNINNGTVFENASITVTSNNCEGKVTVKVGDETYEDVVIGEEFILPLLPVNIYDVSVTYVEDDNYTEAVNDTEKLEITKADAIIIPDVVADAEKSTITLDLPEDATGYVLADVNGTGYYAPVKDGEAVISIPNLEPGNYTAEVTYLGDDNYNNASFEVPLNIPEEPVIEPKDPELKATAENTTVTVTVNKDATGGVIVDVDGTTYYAEIKDGQAIIDVKGLEAGKDYTATVTYTGDDNFTEDETTVEISIPAEPIVEPKDPELKATAENTTVTVTVNKDATGGVIVDVDGTTYYAEIKDGQAIIDVKGLEAGENYTATVTYVGDDNFTEDETTVKISVPKEEEIEPEDASMTVDSTNSTITVELPKDATGYVLVDIDGKGYYAKVTDGKATVDVAGLDAGNYTATVTYTGDDNYKANTSSVAVSIPEEDEPIPEPVTPEMTVKVTNTTIEVTLPKDATGNVLVDVNGQGYYAPVKDGKATVNVIGLDEGNYPATVTYAGDDKYTNASKPASVTVPEDEEPTPEPVNPKADINVSDDAVNVELPKDATGYMLVDVDGKGYYAPVKDGKASIDLPELAPGNHTVTVTYTGDDKYKPATANKTVTVEKEIITVVSENLTKIEKAPDRFEAVFTDSDGNALANKDVTFGLNDITYTRTTDANGKAGMNINLVPGTYSIKTTNPVTNESVTNTITVLPRFTEDSDLVKYFRNDSQYVLKVLDDNGNPAKAGEIVTYNINGVFYNRTTNATGHVKLSINLPPKTYIITAEYKGCKVAHNVTVLPTLTGNDLTKKYGQSGAYEAKLVDGQGKAYANQKIEFNINGVMYQRTTDANGVAKLNINLQAGKYIITASYGQARISNTVTVTA